MKKSTGALFVFSPPPRFWRPAMVPIMDCRVPARLRGRLATAAVHRRTINSKSPSDSGRQSFPVTLRTSTSRPKVVCHRAISSISILSQSNGSSTYTGPFDKSTRRRFPSLTRRRNTPIPRTTYRRLQARTGQPTSLVHIKPSACCGTTAEPKLHSAFLVASFKTT